MGGPPGINAFSIDCVADGNLPGGSVASVTQGGMYLQSRTKVLTHLSKANTVLLASFLGSITSRCSGNIRHERAAEIEPTSFCKFKKTSFLRIA